MIKKLPHNKIVKDLVKEYKKDKNVLGIYLFGSLARGNAHLKSDVDIEIVFNKRKKKYELLHPDLGNGIHIDLSLYKKDKFVEDTGKKSYLFYGGIPYKILYDPTGLLKKQLKIVKDYFKKNPEVTKFWEDEEKKWKAYKKTGYKDKTISAKNYFVLMKEFEKRFGMK